MGTAGQPERGDSSPPRSFPPYIVTGGEGVSMHDYWHELRIRVALWALITSSAATKYFRLRFESLINSRSPKQIARMERRMDGNHGR